MLSVLPVLSLLAFQCSSSLARNSTSKRGISFPSSNNPQDVMNFNQSKSQVNWVYDWGLDRPDYLNPNDTNIEYIPMQWGSGNIENLASSIKAQGAKTLLTFNEPDFDEQSNIAPADAAQLWMQYIEPLKAEGVRLGGPAVTASGTGIPWLTQFFDACSNCTIDFLPLHWYGVGSGGLFDYIFSVHGQFPKYPLWITEYADTELNATEVVAFLNATAAYFDSQDFIERYAWFGYFRPENGSAYNMLNADGSLNALGTAYIGADTVEKSGPATSTPTSTQQLVATAVLKTASVANSDSTPTFVFNSASGLESLPLGSVYLHFGVLLIGQIFAMFWMRL